MQVVCMFECVHVLVSYMNLIVCDTSHDWLLEKVYLNITDTVCVTLIVDVYVMCVHVVLFLCNRRKGPAGTGRCEDGV